MKKLMIAATAAVAVAATSCGESTPSASLKTDVDSVSYALGLTQSQGVKEYISGAMGVDTTYMKEFIKGVVEGAKAGDDKRKAAYLGGIQIGQQIAARMVKGVNNELFGADSTQTISVDNLLAGFISGTNADYKTMTTEKAQEYITTAMNAIKGRTMEKQFGQAKKDNEKFLADNKKKEGVVTLPSGLQYKVIKQGDGQIPADTARVKVNYEGKTIDGTVFDTSYGKQPVIFGVNQVVKGFSEALQKMPVGSTWEVYIPQELAYGANQQGEKIKPFSTLIFKIELLSIEK